MLVCTSSASSIGISLILGLIPICISISASRTVSFLARIAARDQDIFSAKSSDQGMFHKDHQGVILKQNIQTL